MKRICVFCGSRPGTDPEFVAAANEVGTLIASAGMTLVYGGGGRGMMGTLADAALAAGGEVIGVIPRDLFASEHLHPGIDDVRAVESMLERKETMAALSDAFVALPGGIGTMDELFEMWTWTQLRIHAKPNGLLNVNGYFDGLVAFLEHMTAREFLSPDQLGLLSVDTDARRLLARLA